MNLPAVIHLASGNAHKAREMQMLADASGWKVEIRTVAAMPVVVEDTGTFAGNAGKKAAALKLILPPEAWVLADDSGLCVDALAGAPGVESAYFAGPAGDGAANLRKMIETMRDVPEAQRGAQFVCVLVLCRDLGETGTIFEGRCPGRLRREPAGGHGFGYDPLFVPDGATKSFAELTAAEKSRTSHRARAWAKLAGWLRGR